MAFNTQGFIQAAKARGYSDDEINKVVTVMQAQQSSKPNYLEQYGGAGAPAQQSTQMAPLSSFVSKTQDPTPSITAAAKTNPVMQQGQLLPANQDDGRNVLSGIMDFIAPRTMNLAGQAKNAIGMTGDYIGYKLGVNKEKNAKEFQQKAEKMNQLQKDYGFDATKKGNQFDPKQYAKGTTKTALEMQSLTNPVGGSLKSAAGYGLLSGLERGASEGSDFDFGRTVAGGIGGATGGVMGYGVSKAFGAGTKYFADKAAQGYGKATPAQFARIAEEHGVDINSLMQKHLSGVSNYDEAIGGVATRGKGGVLAQKMKQAEDAIQNSLGLSGSNMKISANEFISGMRQEAKNLAKIPGNQRNVTALNEFIKEAEHIFKNGITPKRLMEIKRIADSKFGRAVVDEQTGSVAAQGQKALANFARKKLRTMFPEIADALDTQSEIYILQPLLNKARGIAKTQGSTIRTGKLTSLTDLINPTKYVEAAANLPQISSKVMGLANESGVSGALSKASPAVQYVGRNMGAQAGSAIGGALANQSVQSNQQPAANNNYSATNGSENYQGAGNVNSNVNHDNYATIPYPQSQQQYITGKSPEQWIQMSQAAFGNGDFKAQAYFDEMYTKETAFQKTSGSQGKLSSNQVNNIADLNSSSDLLDTLELQLKGSSAGRGPLLGRITGSNPYDTNAQVLQSDIKAAAQVVGKALEGGVLRKEDVPKYEAILPKMTDTPEVAQKKLENVRLMIQNKKQSLLGTYHSLGTGYDDMLYQLPQITVNQ